MQRMRQKEKCMKSALETNFSFEDATIRNAVKPERWEVTKAFGCCQLSEDNENLQSFDIAET
jgi:hypothetical protein